MAFTKIVIVNERKTSYFEIRFTEYTIRFHCIEILSDYGLISSADALVNIFIFMIVQAEVKNIVSNIM